VISAWNRPFLRFSGTLMAMGLIHEPAYALLVYCEGGLLAAIRPAPTVSMPSSCTCRKSGASSGRSAASTAIFPIATHAIAEGGHVSIGIGDYDDPNLAGRRTRTWCERSCAWRASSARDCDTRRGQAMLAL
jgi:hypothetical protein